MPEHKRAEPKASRPHIPPQYGIVGPKEGKGLLPWSWATERLSRSRGYWIATTRPDGRPHATVIWGVWLDDRFYFATIEGSRKARNVAANPRCVVCAEDTHEAIVVEGVAEQVADSEVIRQFKMLYEAKYQDEIEPDQFLIYEIRPCVAFATISDAVDFPATATRWQFKDQ